MELGKSRSVLVIDDEPAVCELIGRVLGERQLSVTSVMDSPSALRLIEQGQFDAVVCDARMPHPTGLELLAASRRHCPRAPFILITGSASIDDAKRAIRQGAYDYLEKPFEIDVLCGLIEQALAGRPSEAALPAWDVGADASVESAGDLACRDGLTGLLAPRAFFEQLSAIRLASLAGRRTCSLAILDIDEFSDANQMFGYSFGDEVLRALASCLREQFGADVPLCRLGQDRFAAALPAVDEQAAAQQCEKLRERFSRHRLSWQDHPVSLTVSVGLAETGAGFAVSEAELHGRAAQALQEAKRAGRNRVVAYGDLLGAANAQWALVTEQLRKAAEEAQHINRQLRLTCLESVGALVSAVEAKDPYTRRHSEQVAYYAEQFARHMGLAGDAIETIRVAAIMHDVGKIGIPDTVLTKPGKLTDEEFALIRDHPRMGENILLKISMLTAESRLIRHHHENWDGSGYPDHLSGEHIPLGARIIQTADCIDAMLMRRVYKEPLPVSKVLDELARGRGTQFDPALVDTASEWMRANPRMIIHPEM